MLGVVSGGVKGGCEKMAQTKMWLASEPAVSFTFVDEPVGVSLFDIQRNRLGQWDATLMQVRLFSEHLTRVVLNRSRKAFVDLHSLLEQLWFCGPDVQPA